MAIDTITVFAIEDGSFQVLPPGPAIDLVLSDPLHYRMELPFADMSFTAGGLLNAYRSSTGNADATFGDMMDALRGPAGDEGDPGVQGPQGPAGQAGTGITFKGNVNEEADLPGGATTGDSYTVVNARVTLVTAASATGAAQSWFGGEAYIDGYGTFDGAVVELQRRADDGVTWNAFANVSMNEPTDGPIGILPPGQFRAAITGGGGAKSITVKLSYSGGLRRTWNGTLWAIDGPAGVPGPPGEPGADKATLAQTDAGSVVSAYTDPAQTHRVAVIRARGNPDFSLVDTIGQAPAGWTMPAPAGVVAAGGQYGANRVQFDAATYLLGPLEPVDVEAAFHVSARFWILSGTPTVNVGVACYDASGTFIGSRYSAANSLAGMSSALGAREVGGIISGVGGTKNNFYDGTKFIKRRAHIVGVGTWAVDYFRFRELERGQVIRSSLWKARPGGNKIWNKDLFNDFVGYLYANGGYGLIDVPGIYDLDDTIDAGAITGVLPWTLSGMGLTTKLRRATAAMGTVIDLLGSNIEVTNLAIDGGRDTIAGGTHALTIEGGGGNKATKLDIRNFHSAAIIMSGTTPHTYERNAIEGCYIDGMDRAWNGVMHVKTDHSAIVNTHVRRVRPLLDTAATPCYALQTKDYTDYCLITGCTAYECQTGLRAGGVDDDNDEDNSDIDNYNLTVIGCKIKGGGVPGLRPYGARFVRQKFGMVTGLDVDCQNIAGMAAIKFQYLCENISVSAAVRSVYLTDQGNTSSDSRAIIFDDSDDCQVTIEIAKSIGDKPIKWKDSSANNTVYIKHHDNKPTLPAGYAVSDGGGAGNKVIHLRALAGV